MSEDQGFEVVDRRRVSASGDAPPEDAPSGGGAAEEMAPGEEDLLGDLPPFNPLLQMNVGTVLRMTLGLLNDKAWINLGLYPDPITSQVEKNLPEARRAIDAIADLIKHVEADAPPEEKRELQVMLSNLRLNFVKQSQG